MAFWRKKESESCDVSAQEDASFVISKLPQKHRNALQESCVCVCHVCVMCVCVSCVCVCVVCVVSV
jgi:hypothetical protein